MKMNIIKALGRTVVLLILAVSTLDSAALAGKLAGATLPDTLKVGDKTLKLNGLGLRKKAIIKVYVGGLYLESSSKDANAILASDQSKAITLFLLRDLTKTQLVEAFQESFEENAAAKAGQKAAFDKMLALIPDVKEGETLTFAYLPGKGMTLQAGNKELGTFESKFFADAIFSIWLGTKPLSEELNKGILG